MSKISLVFTTLLIMLGLCFLACSKKSDDSQDKTQAVELTTISSETAEQNKSPEASQVPSSEQSENVEKTPPAVKPLSIASNVYNTQHILYKPFKTLMANDFEIGPLYTSSNDPKLLDILKKLKQDIIKGSISKEIFAPDVFLVFSSIYNAETLKNIKDVRFSIINTDEKTTALIRVRLFATDKETMKYNEMASADGILILQKADNANWLVQNLELDTESLNTAPTKTELWDPYKLNLGKP